MTAQGAALGERDAIESDSPEGASRYDGPGANPARPETAFRTPTSVPHVTLIVWNLIFCKEVAVFLLEGSHAMMLPLIPDVRS